MRDWEARAAVHAVVAAVLLPIGVAAAALGLLRLVGVGVAVLDDIRVASTGGAGVVLGLVVLGGGLSWLGLREAQHCFAIVHAEKDR